MAGYMTKLQGYVYEGELENGSSAAIENGTLVAPALVNSKLVFKLPSTDTDTKFLCKEVTTIYDGITAYRFIVTGLGAGKLYFVENGFENDETAEYDNTLYTTAVGKLLRAHPLSIGDEFVTTFVNGTPVVGTEYTVLATGKVG